MHSFLGFSWLRLPTLPHLGLGLGLHKSFDKRLLNDLGGIKKTFGKLSWMFDKLTLRVPVNGFYKQVHRVLVT